jgi:hypothetical protein
MCVRDIVTIACSIGDGSKVKAVQVMIALKTLSLIGGTLLIILGIITSFIPIVPQIPFFLAGFALLSYSSPRVRRVIEPIVKRADETMRAIVERLKR